MFLEPYHLGFWSRIFTRSTAGDDMSPSKKGFASLSGAGEKISVNDFHLLKIVGKGAFGKVYFIFFHFSVRIYE